MNWSEIEARYQREQELIKQELEDRKELWLALGMGVLFSLPFLFIAGFAVYLLLFR